MKAAYAKKHDEAAGGQAAKFLKADISHSSRADNDLNAEIVRSNTCSVLV